jgi:N-acetylmuramic acid 6-phosphate etherase
MIFEKISKKRIKKDFLRFFLLSAGIIFLAASSLSNPYRSSQESQSLSEKKPPLLRLLDIMPSPESIEFVQGKTRFQLHTLPAEQRHPKTWNLSERTKQDPEAGLRMLSSVDEDIVSKLASLERERNVLDEPVKAVEEAILTGHKIYLFGGEETGRWTMLIENSLWRPFWKALKKNRKIWSKAAPVVGDTIEDRLTGEMPGGDRALIHSLPGLADLPLIGRLQLVERGIEAGDVILGVTGSGATPAVIGSVSEALDQWKGQYPYDAEKIRKKLFLFLNDPPEDLLSFDQVRAVLEDPAITKIDLTTGPQALTGSMRMQASTIDTFVIGNIVQAAIDRSLRQILSNREMEKLGFRNPIILRDRLAEFSRILKRVERIIPSITRLSRWEENAYREGHSVTYSALRGIGTVFNDCAERSSTFFLPPLDTIDAEPPKSPIRVWALKEDQEEAWLVLLGRPFRGLSSTVYEKKIEEETIDPVLRQTALQSLKNAGGDQQFLYDFAFSDNNRQNHRPQKDDLAILVMVSPEEDLIDDKKSDFFKFVSDFYQNGAKLGLLFLTELSEEKIRNLIDKIPGFSPEATSLAVLALDDEDDPMGLNRQIALKIILNAHSTAVMTRMGKVIGNSVLDFDPDDFESVDRATYLIQSYVNDILQIPQWVKKYGIQQPISFGEANAVLYDAIAFMKERMKTDGQAKAVALSIVRILESIRLNRAFSQDDALSIVRKKGLEAYLENVTNQKPQTD